ncbi:unnamed protein product [Choristocarpus tenellus]
MADKITTAQEQQYERLYELGIVVKEEHENPAKRDRQGVRRTLSGNMLRGVFAEFLGSLLFLFFVISTARLVEPDTALTDASGTRLMVALSFGLTIFVLVYVLASASGANLNPAVSIGLLVGKRISLERFVLYVIAQASREFWTGAGIASTFKESSAGGQNEIADGIDVEDAFGGEVICTFMLVLTVFAATDGEMGRKLHHIQPMLPLAIGMAVTIAHLVLIPVDGCSINPARSLATSVTNNHYDDHWVFWVGPMLGGVLATCVWEVILRPKHPVLPSNMVALAQEQGAC